MCLYVFVFRLENAKYGCIENCLIFVRHDSLLTLRGAYIDGNSEKNAHIRSNLCYLICLSHLIRLREVAHRIF